MKVKRNLLFVSILVIAGIGYGIPILVAAGTGPETLAEEFPIVKTSPTPTPSVESIPTQEASPTLFFTATASVTSTSTSPAGVMSKTGFQTLVPGGAVGTPPHARSSVDSRISMGIAAPSGVSGSKVEDGATTMNRTPCWRGR